MRGTTLLVLALGALAGICTVAGLVLLAASWSTPVADAWGFRGFTSIFAVAYTSVGGILAARRPANRVSWMLFAVGVAAAVQFAAEGYAIYGVIDRAVPLPGAVFAGWVESWIWLAGVGLVPTYILLLFPNGSLVSPRWRMVEGLAGVTIGFGVLALMFSGGPLNNARFIENPYPLLGGIGVLDRPLFVAAFFALGFLAPASAFSLVVRYRRSAGVERQQLKWLAVAGVLIAITIAHNVVTQLVAPDAKLAQVELIAAFGLFPVAMGVAMLRYRLYDIDILINRAIVYGATTAAVGLAFFAGIVVFQGILRPLTSGSEIAVAVSTLASVALAQPVRARIQGVVDRRFYRSRYDAVRALDTFTGRLRDEVDLDAVRTDLLDAVRETVQPAHASVWLRERGT